MTETWFAAISWLIMGCAGIFVFPGPFNWFSAVGGVAGFLYCLYSAAGDSYSNVTFQRHPYYQPQEPYKEFKRVTKPVASPNPFKIDEPPKREAIEEEITMSTIEPKKEGQIWDSEKRVWKDINDPSIPMDLYISERDICILDGMADQFDMTNITKLDEYSPHFVVVATDVVDIKRKVHLFAEALRSFRKIKGEESSEEAGKERMKALLGI